MLNLDIGCGRRKIPGFIGIDHIPWDGVDIIASIENLPIKTAVCNKIRCYHVLEHLNHPIQAMEEAWRVLKTEGIYEIQVPHFTGMADHSDITHKRAFSSLSLDHFCENKIKKRGIPPYTAWFFNLDRVKLNFHDLNRVGKQFERFKVGSLVVKIIDFLAAQNIVIAERFWGRLIGGFDHITFWLRKI